MQYALLIAGIATGAATVHTLRVHGGNWSKVRHIYFDPDALRIVPVPCVRARNLALPQVTGAYGARRCGARALDSARSPARPRTLSMIFASSAGGFSMAVLTHTQYSEHFGNW
ncbi:hypothetical protein [Streptomyces sp. CRN 30]|uniref:hypothetical protein n=1 Tax=Streptomyces sp. CRN 30 TaxID=3075613 RepID=UPI002A83243E|nr:hypothetical protein [Streptomyces sp. CRN 30]